MDSKTLKILHSLDSESNPESSDSTTEPNNGMGEDCKMTRSKRKTSINQESPRKRQKGASEPTVMAVEAVMAKGTNRKARTERDVPKKRQKSHNNITGASEPTEVAVQAVATKGTKRKSSTKRESPKKKQRGHSEPTEMQVEDVTANGTKRKANTEAETPSKKQRGGSNDTDTNTVEPTKMSVEDVRERKSKKEASAEQLPATETPRMTKRESGCDLSLSFSGPSTSKQNNGSMSYSVKTSRANFEAKYLQLDKLGEGGFGSVYAGNRKTDNLPVAIKHIPKADVESRPMVLHGKTYMVPMEVLLMLRVTGGPESMGKSAAVSLLDWYELDQEVLLVMERPVPSVDLLNYLYNNDGPLEEDQAKNIMKQLVKAAIKMHSEGVFHSDIKTENVLVETCTDVLRVRVIDFGCGCFVKKRPYRSFSGTSAYAPPEFYILGAYEAGPTTVWQLGALLYELLDGYKQFTTSKFLRKKIQFISELKVLKVSQDCQDLLKMCLTVNPKERATLEQMQLHPWFT
ncbi:serine/threonine-protein kinase pim-2-like [Siniperca chuatsi]|uniref:serine/threonine-protein kinase pim-2-like n=1 Tax=Siniperca chuatsi TaxID=119488 RepID=UPI001CE15853|nr:serine/threonine-protein kinase pim-2-like [Siniperca chuatsi]